MPRGKKRVPKKKKVPRKRKKGGSSRVGGALRKKHAARRKRVGGAMSKVKKALAGLGAAIGFGGLAYGGYKSGKAVSGLYRGMEALHPSTSFFPKRKRR